MPKNLVRFIRLVAKRRWGYSPSRLARIARLRGSLMDVVAIVPSREHPSTRYRIRLFQRHFESAGLRLRLEPLAQLPGERLKQISRRRSHELVILQRKLLPVWQTLLLKQRCAGLIYDFDDAVFFRDSFHPRGAYSLTRLVRFQAMMGAADLILAGNRYLAEFARRTTSSRKIEVIPTCVDPDRYTPARHRDHRSLRLVWIGSSSTLQSLEEGRAVLEAIGQRIPGTKLRVVCDRFPRFRHLEVERYRWSEEGEVAGLSRSDVGISWLSDDHWSRGKCGLKVLQYMAAGLPVIASPTGVHSELLEDQWGMLPKNEGEWLEAVEHLSQDPARRCRMGRLARHRLEEAYSPARWGPVIAERLRDQANRA